MKSTIVLVPDGSTIIDTTHVVRMVQKQGDVKAAAGALGVEYTRLWRFLRAQGYEINREIRAKSPVAKKVARRG